MGDRDQAGERQARGAGQCIATWLVEAGFDDLPITVEHATAAGALPLHHRDPFDRMLIAQARIENLTLVAHDDEITKYDVPVIDARA